MLLFLSKRVQPKKGPLKTERPIQELAEAEVWHIKLSKSQSPLTQTMRSEGPKRFQQHANSERKYENPKFEGLQIWGLHPTRAYNCLC